MSCETKLETNLRDVIECVSEAARLHLALKTASTKDAVVGALVWRFGIDQWQAGNCYDAALLLIDKLPRK